MGTIATVEQTKAPFWEAIEAFERGFAEVTQRFTYLPPKVGGCDWRIAMSDHVGRALFDLGWSLSEVAADAERRAYGYIKQGGRNSFSTSVASPNTIRRLKAALQRLRPAPSVPVEVQPGSWLW